MKTSTCTNCQGRGVETDYGSRYQTSGNSYAYRDRPCTSCSGSGVLYDYSYTAPTPIKTPSKPAVATLNTTKATTSKKTSGSDFSTNDFFMLVGFITGGVAAYQVTDNWIAIGITALISGVVLRITYKLLFVILILLVLFYFYNQ